MSKDWKNSIRDTFEGYQMPEPEGLWEGVESGLPQKTSWAVRKPLFWISGAVSAAAVLAAVLVLGGRHTLPVPVKDRMVAVVEESTEPHPFSVEPSVQDDRNVPGPAAMRTPLSSSSVAETVTVDASGLMDSADEDYTTVQVGSVPESADSGTMEQMRENVKKEPAVDIEEYFRTNDMKAVRRVRKVSLLASASGTGGFSDSYKSHGIMSMSDRTVVNVASSLASNYSDVTDYTKVIWLNCATEYDVNVEYKHRQPVRLSFEAEYPLSSNLALVSGLAITRLTSDLTSESLMSNYNVEQRLDYVGIPLALKYRVVGDSGRGLYARAGAMVEKNFSGNSITRYLGVGDVTYSIGHKERVSEKAVQCSFNLSVGSDIKIWGPVRGFVEPGLSFYPDNGSDVKNIYKEKPLNFNLAIGIRTDL